MEEELKTKSGNFGVDGKDARQLGVCRDWYYIQN